MVELHLYVSEESIILCASRKADTGLYVVSFPVVEFFADNKSGFLSEIIRILTEKTKLVDISSGIPDEPIKKVRKLAKVRSPKELYQKRKMITVALENNMLLLIPRVKSPTSKGLIRDKENIVHLPLDIEPDLFWEEIEKLRLKMPGYK